MIKEQLAISRSSLHDLLPGLVPHPYDSHPNCSPTAAQLHCVWPVQSLHSPREPSSWHPLCQQYFFKYGVCPPTIKLSGVLVRNTDYVRLLHTVDPAFLGVKPKNLHFTKMPRVSLSTLKHETFFIRKSKFFQREYFMMESLVTSPSSSFDTSPCGLCSNSNKLRTCQKYQMTLRSLDTVAGPHLIASAHPFLEFPPPLPAKLLFISHM